MGEMSRQDTMGSLAGGGSASKAAQVFRRMDADNNGALDFSEMLQALQELGVLVGVTATDATKVLQRELKEADTDKNGLIDLQEFQSYFQRMAIYQQNEARTQRLKSSCKNMPSGADRNPVLKSTFRTFCQVGKSHIIGAGSLTNVSLEELRMNARQFSRLCKDAGILKPIGSLEAITADVIFAQCKIPGDRNMNFKKDLLNFTKDHKLCLKTRYFSKHIKRHSQRQEGFLDALGVLAEGMDTSYEDVIRLLEGDHEKGTANESLVKSSPRKSIQRPSIVAQAWRKPSFAGTSEMLPRNDRPGELTARGDSERPSEKLRQTDYQRLLKEAKDEAIREAGKAWSEQKLEMQNHILQLQDIISHLQSDTPLTDSMSPMARNHTKQLPEGLRQEMEDWKRQMMGAIQDRMDTLQAPGRAESISVDKLRLQVVQLEDVISHMAETQASFASGSTGFSGSTETAPAADLEEAVQALEERALERQARLEAALIQVAMKVDLLEKKLSAM